MRMLTPAAAVLLFAATLAGQGSAPAQAPARGVVAGRVIDGTTARPVAGALVTLSAPPAGLGALGRGESVPLDRLMSVNIGSVLSGSHQVIADGQGRFSFTGLAAGAFSLSASKPGWTGGAFGLLRPDGSGSMLQLAAGAQMTAVSLRLWKNAAIAGSVVDEAGEPIVGVAVRALRRTWQAGHARYSSAGAAQTDDRGVYRIGALRPGEYIVAVPQTSASAPVGAAPASFDPAMIRSLIAANGPGMDPNALIGTITALAGGGSSGGIRHGNWVLKTTAPGSRLIPPASDERGRVLAYRTTFYPDVVAPAQASPVRLDSGEEHTGIDFALKPSVVSQLGGTITGPEGPAANLTVRLQIAEEAALASDAGLDVATTTTDAHGEFMFLAVPAGQYTLESVRLPQPTGRGNGLGAMPISVMQTGAGGRAMSLDGAMTMDMLMPPAGAVTSEPTLWASVPVMSAGADQMDLPVTLRRGYRLRGRAEFDGAAPRPSGAQLSRMPLGLDRAETAGAAGGGPAMGQSPDGQFDENGQFATREFVPGKYFLRVPFAFSGWTVGSISIGGRDVSDEAIDLVDADIGDVIVTFTDRPAGVSGSARSSQKDQPVSVIIFPVQRIQWTDFGSSPRRIRTARADATGHFDLNDVPAGDYFAAAVDGEIGGDWQNPDYLDALSRGATRVSVGVGEKKTVDLVVR